MEVCQRHGSQAEVQEVEGILGDLEKGGRQAGAVQWLAGQLSTAATAWSKRKVAASDRNEMEATACGSRCCSKASDCAATGSCH